MRSEEFQHFWRRYHIIYAMCSTAAFSIMAQFLTKRYLESFYSGSEKSREEKGRHFPTVASNHAGQSWR